MSKQTPQQLRVALIAGLVADLRTHDGAVLNREYGELYRAFRDAIDDYAAVGGFEREWRVVLDKLADWLEGAIDID